MSAVSPEIEAIDRVLLGADASPPQPVEALARYRVAAERGDALGATRVAMMRAQGLAGEADWGEALRWFALAAALGDEAAHRQIELIVGRALRGEAELRAAVEAVDVTALLTCSPVRPLLEGARIGVLERFAEPGVCEWLIARASGMLQPTLVYSGGQLRAHPARTGTNARFSLLRSDLIVALLQARLARTIGFGVALHEVPNVLSYEVGQKFGEHVDFVDPTMFAAEIAERGQRAVTCLTYLNDDYQGGETRFSLLDLLFRGRPGDALLFFNVTPEGAPDRRTRHAGLPPTAGRKWVLSQWVRDKPQPLS